jgi:hypothetical protein
MRQNCQREFCLDLPLNATSNDKGVDKGVDLGLKKPLHLPKRTNLFGNIRTHTPEDGSPQLALGVFFLEFLKIFLAKVY